MTSPSQLESVCGKFIRNSLDSPPNTARTGMKKGNTELSSLFCTWFCSPLFRINTFSISVVPPLWESLCWCTKHNECQARSTAVKPPTSHLQDPDNISYCLPVCPLASLQWPVYNPSSGTSEPKKTSLMQLCCNMSPLPVAGTMLTINSDFSVTAEAKHGAVIRAQRPTNSSRESHMSLTQCLGIMNKLALKWKL